ncbi:hypothetical protein M8J76_005410 [Diaphorina citri]|nr:hypothetical protein M8J76_005410 [Diaphorina citri]
MNLHSLIWPSKILVETVLTFVLLAHCTKGIRFELPPHHHEEQNVDKLLQDLKINTGQALSSREICKVEYPGNVSVNLGNTLTPTQVKEQPHVSWSANPKDHYVLCMTDPDAPSRDYPIAREWHHWLMGNIKGGNLEGADHLSRYIGAGPPKQTGPHRYAFLVYKQPNYTVFDEPRLMHNSIHGRANFSIAKFAKKYKLGDPIAVNYFLAEFDDYVPKLYEKLFGSVRVTSTVNY